MKSGSKMSELMRGGQAFISKRSPEILTGVGIAGMFTTVVLAVKATPKAIKLMEKAEREKDDILTPVDKVKACWKPYLPAAITGVASTMCLLGANSVYARRTAALAAAYQISETAITEYRDKVVETIGENKEKLVREKVDRKHLEENPVSTREVIVTKAGGTLCYDTLSGRYFKSDIEKIKKTENELNRRMIQEHYISLNAFYDELELEHTAIGDDLGWNLDRGMIDIYFTSQIADDGTPCIVLNYSIAPKYDYERFI